MSAGRASVPKSSLRGLRSDEEEGSNGLGRRSSSTSFIRAANTSAPSGIAGCRPALWRCGSTASIRTSLAWTAIGRCFAISRFRGNRARNLNWAKSPRNRGQITSAPEGGVGCTAPRTRPSAEGRNRAGGQALRSTRCGHQRCRRVFRALGIALLPNIREAVAALIDGPCRPKRGAKNDVTARNYLKKALS